MTFMISASELSLALWWRVVWFDLVVQNLRSDKHSDSRRTVKSPSPLARLGPPGGGGSATWSALACMIEFISFFAKPWDESTILPLDADWRANPVLRATERVDVAPYYYGEGFPSSLEDARAASTDVTDATSWTREIGTLTRAWWCRRREGSLG